MRKFKFVEDQPGEGTLTLGVVYHITREREIEEFRPEFGPIGWVVEDLSEEPHDEKI